MSAVATDETKGLPAAVIKQGKKARDLQAKHIADQETAEQANQAQGTAEAASQEEPPKVPEKKKTPEKPKKENKTADTDGKEKEQGTASPPETPKDENAEFWEQRYKISEGNIKQQSADHKAKIIALENNVNQQRDIISKLADPDESVSAEQSSASTATAVSQIEYTQEEKEDWGEQLAIMNKTVEMHLAPIVEKLNSFEGIAKDLTNIRNEIQGMNLSHKEAAQKTFSEQLDGLSPGWEKYVGKDAVHGNEFSTWANSNAPDLSIYTFGEQFDEANKDGNAEIVSGIINHYKTVAGHVPPVQKTPEAINTAPAPVAPVAPVAVVAPLASIEEQVTPVSAAGDSSEASASNNKPLIRKRQYMDDVNDFNAKKITEEELKKCRIEYYEAMADGRIVN